MHAYRAPRILTALLFSLAALLPPTLGAQEAEQITIPAAAPLRGDVDGDGRVTTRDARMVTAHAAGGEQIPDARMAMADADGDARISSRDALLIESFARGRDVARFGVGQPLGEDDLLNGVIRFSSAPLGSAVTIRTGHGQTGVAGDTLPGIVSVLVKDGMGNAVSGVEVLWSASGTDGRVRRVKTGTSGTGNSGNRWKLGATPGTQTLTATVKVTGSPDQVVEFSATAVDSTGLKIEIVGGNNLRGVAGDTVGVEQRVRVATVAGDQPVAAKVTWTARDGSSARFATTHSTLGNGSSFNRWLLGATPGPQRLVARIPGGDSVVFVNNAVDPDDVTFSVYDGNNQSAAPGATLPQPLRARAMSPGGPVSVVVRWSVLTGGGSLPSSRPYTISSGVTNATWTLGSTPGAQTAQVEMTGKPAVVFTATAGNNDPVLLAIADGDGQSATVNTAVATAPRVRVTDADGNGVAGVTVTFAVAGGGGSITGPTPSTDADGYASVGSWTLGTTAGANSLTASATGLADVTFNATGTPGGLDHFTVDSPGGPIGAQAAGTSFDIRVTARDAHDNVVTSFTGTVEITSSGDLSAGGGTTAAFAAGVLATHAVTVTSTGSTTITATRTGGTETGTSDVFTVSAGAPANMVASAGDGQTATAGSAVATAPAVTVTDASGNPVAGVSVTFAVASGGGSVTGENATTDASGVAAVGSWTLGATAGANTLDASATGLTTVTFTATGTPGAAANLAQSAGDGQSATVGSAVATAPAVTVTDANGNPVAGVAVTFAVASGGGSVTGENATTDASGVATLGSWTLGTTAGANTLDAASAGLTTVTFSATGTPGAVASFSVQAAGGGSIGAQLAGTPFNVQVTARDAHGNTATSFTGTVGFTSTPAGITAGAGPSAAFTAGVLGSHAVTIGSSGDYTLTATRTGGTEAGTSNQFQVQAAPAAVADGPTASSAPGNPYHGAFNTTFTLPSLGLMSNDNRGYPLATVLSFGADSLGGAVTDHPAGNTPVTLPGGVGSITVRTDGSVSFTPRTGFTGLYVFKYRISNVRGTSDAQVTIAIGARPVAWGDNYSLSTGASLVGNVPINTATSSGFRVTSNDEGDAKILTVTGATNGTATLNADSTFQFTPTAGFTGDSVRFTYTVKNGFGTSAPATVSANVSGIAWFINRGAAAGGDGRFGTPFNDLSTAFAAGTRPAASQPVFLYSHGTSYTGGVTLLAGQKLVGQGASGGGETFASIMGVTWPADAGAQPSLAGTSPTVSGNLVLGSGNTLRGFNMSGAVTLSGTSFGTLTVGQVGINSTAQALNLNTGTINGGFTQVQSTGGTNNVSLTSVGTSSPVALGTSADALSGASGDGLVINDGTGSFTFAGSITNTSASGSAVNISNKDGGTVTLSGSINPVSAGRGITVANNNNGTNTINFTGSNVKIGGNPTAGVNLSSNTGATISFTGGNLAISTAATAGFRATGGGNVNVTGSANTVTTTTGTGVSFSNTTVGSSGVTFRSVSHSGGSNGISLVNTGASGAFAVTGNGAAGTGGTIAGTTGGDGAPEGNGVYLENVTSVRLARMQLNGHANHAIRGITVTTFVLDSSVVNGTNGTNPSDGTFNEGAIHFDNLAGASMIRQSTVSGGIMDNLYVANTSGSPTLNRLQLLNNTFGGTINQDAVRLSATVGVFNVTATQNTFDYWEGDGFDMLVQGTATGDLVFQNNTSHNTNASPVSGSTNIAVGGGGFTYNISNNSFRGASGSAVAVDESGSLSTGVSGTIHNNQIGATGVANSGSSGGSAITLLHWGAGTSTHRVSNNTIRQINGGQAILVQVGDASAGGGNGTLNTTVVGNNIQEEGSLAATRTAMNFNIGTATGDAHTACLQIGGSGAEENFLNFDANRLRTQHRFNTTIRMPGYSGGVYSTTDVGNYLSPRNDISGLPNTNNAATSSTGGGYQNTAGSASCPQPST